MTHRRIGEEHTQELHDTGRGCMFVCKTERGTHGEVTEDEHTSEETYEYNRNKLHPRGSILPHRHLGVKLSNNVIESPTSKHYEQN